MKRIPLFVLTGMAAALPALLVGCSAGTSSSLPTQTLQQPGADAKAADATRSAADQAKSDDAMLKAPRVGLFITGIAPSKSATEAYSHVWVTILKVELLDEKDVAQTVWDGGTDGTTLDLTTLTGNSIVAGTPPVNRFIALTGAPATAAKAVQRVRVTLGKAFELYQPGTTTAQTTLLSDTIAHDTAGNPIISYQLSKPRDLSSGKDNLVIAFDLGKLAVTDGKATPALDDGDAAGLKDLTRQVPTTFAGVVSGIAGGTPDAKFVLTPDTSGLPPVVVQMSGATALFNDDATPNPALADKKRVAVSGILAPDTKRIVAAEITTFPGDKPAVGGALVEGAVSHVSAEAKTFVVDATEVEGVDPTLGAITVTMAPDAVLRSRGGLILTGDEFWAALTAKGEAPIARVSGTYDPVTGTLTAKRAKFEVANPTATHEASVEGSPKLVDIDAHTFTIASPLVQWDGIAAPGDKSKGIPVTVTAGTAFHDENGNPVQPPHFFDAALAAKTKGEIVRVIGLYSKGSLIATRIELRPAPTTTATAAPSPAASPAADATSAAATPPPNAATAVTAAAANAVSAAVAAAGSNAVPANVKAALTPASPAPAASPTN